MILLRVEVVASLSGFGWVSEDLRRILEDGMARLKERVVDEAIEAAVEELVENSGVEELDDGSIAVVLTRGKNKGVRVVLRDADANDLKDMDTVKGGSMEKTLRLISRLCVSWGDKSGITYPELIESGFLRAKDLMVLGALLSEYFL